MNKMVWSEPPIAESIEAFVQELVDRALRGSLDTVLRQAGAVQEAVGAWLALLLQLEEAGGAGGERYGLCCIPSSHIIEWSA